MGMRLSLLTATGVWVALLATAAPADAGECYDALITAGVKARLVTDDVIGAFKIHVDTEECMVTLRGCVDTHDQIKQATRLARKSKGVKAVKPQLSICGK